MSPLFPAILIGGPPHSGKTTLTYRLSHALRQRGIDHYALRASPDGEGDWTLEAPQALVAELRMRAKTDWTDTFAAMMSRDIDNRHLPLLVDAGGKPSAETEMIASVCTHALLLAANLDDLAPWHALLARQGRAVIAELQSHLDGPQQVVETMPILRGTLSGLGHGRSCEGICFTALLDHLTSYMAYPPDRMYREHLTRTPIELVINVERQIYPLPQLSPKTWQPSHLPELLASLPTHEPLGIYGRGPNWLYGALAAFTQPEPQVFNPFQGWVTPPLLCRTDTADTERLRWDELTDTRDSIAVQFSIPGSYLDHRDATNLPVPQGDRTRGIIVGGKLPNWLYAALARTYRGHVAWIAIFQPQINGGVVVWSQVAGKEVGDVV